MAARITQIAYLDCPTGISGDMCLGALVDAGVPLEYLTQQLARLGIAEEYQLQATRVHRNGQAATKVRVELQSRPTAPVGLTQAQTHAAHTHAHAEPSSDRSLTQPNSAHAWHSPTNHLSLGHHQHHSEHHSHEHHSHEHHSHEHHPHEHHPHEHQHSEPNHQPEQSPDAHPTHAHHGTRHLPEIEQLILSAQLPDRVTQWSLAIFRQLAVAEGAVHGISPEEVHFHEVGATDAIVDIVGTCLGLDYLGIERLYCSAMPVGGGTVWAAHGRLPVPPPAVLKLFEMGQVPLYSNGINKELVTPTGAAIVTTLASQFGPPPSMQLNRVGLGAGSQDLVLPNILRLWLGTTEIIPHHPVQNQPQPDAAARPIVPSSQPQETPAHAYPQETVTVLETQIDDLNPQAIGYVMSELLSAGALDVFTQAIGMKKSRPGTLLTVICRPEQAHTCETILFQETTTLGIRRFEQQRSTLERSIESVITPYGSVRVKVAQSEGKVFNVQPEYEDCVHLAQKLDLPWREVHRISLQAWYDRH